MGVVGTCGSDQCGQHGGRVGRRQGWRRARSLPMPRRHGTLLSRVGSVGVGVWRRIRNDGALYASPPPWPHMGGAEQKTPRARARDLPPHPLGFGPSKVLWAWLLPQTTPAGGTTRPRLRVQDAQARLRGRGGACGGGTGRRHPKRGGGHGPAVEPSLSKRAEGTTMENLTALPLLPTTQNPRKAPTSTQEGHRGKARPAPSLA